MLENPGKSISCSCLEVNKDSCSLVHTIAEFKKDLTLEKRGVLYIAVTIPQDYNNLD